MIFWELNNKFSKRRLIVKFTNAIKIGFILIFCSKTPFAALHDRGGGLIYDDVLNITWLQDANYARTQGYGLIQNGGLTWYDALTWAANLTYHDSVRNVTWDDWRLPDISPLDPSKGWQMQISTDGDQDDSYNVSAPGTKYAGSTASELPYMYFNNLGNTSRCPVGLGFGGCSTAGASSFTLKTGPFINLEKNFYWTGSNENLPFADGWGLDMGSLWGVQGAFNAGVPHVAWAVRDGDVALIPVPASIILFGSTVMGWLGARRFRT
jgi:hypothetical protein